MEGLAGNCQKPKWPGFVHLLHNAAFSGRKLKTIAKNIIKGMQNMNAIKQKYNFIVSAVFFIISTCLVTFLLIESKIGEPSFIILITLFLMGSFIIAFHKNIDSLKAKDFEVKFKEIKDSEILVKKLSLELVNLTELNNKSAIRLTNFNQNEFDEIIKNIKKIAE